MKLTLRIICIFLLFSLILSAKFNKHKGKKGKKRVQRNGNGHYHFALQEAKYMVAMVRLYEGYHEYICSGVIITRHIVLTTKSCAREPTAMEIDLGKVIIRGGTQWVQGTGGIDHRIDGTWYYRFSYIGFIKVKNEFIFERFQEAKVLKFSTYNYTWAFDKILDIFGWGETLHNYAGSETLKVVWGRPIEYRHCAEAYKNDDISHNICIKTFPGSVCIKGDGNPMFDNDILVGLSIGPFNSCNGKPGIYLGVDAIYPEFLNATRYFKIK